MADLFSMLQSHSACLALHALHKNGVLKEFEQPQDVVSVAGRYSLEPARLLSILQFICATSSILLSDGESRFVLSAEYRPYEALGFHLDKFLGGYGPILSDIGSALSVKEADRPVIDGEALAEAFGKVRSGGEEFLSRLVASWGVRSLLDLGCGCGGILCEFATLDPDHRGWGIDQNPSMCAVASERIDERGLRKQLAVVCGDAVRVGGAFDLETLNAVDGLVGRSIMNELFGDGSRQAVDFLKVLRQIFPTRLFFVIDYYGKLGRLDGESKPISHTFVHDLVQVLSGQGVPPGSRDQWNDVYIEAGCECVHVYEGEAVQMQWFVHVVRL